MFYDFNNNKELNISGQFFSGTDKSTTGTLGVVFPLACHKDVNNTLNVSSVLDHRNDNILCKHTEARVATANVEEKVVEYVETRCIAIEYNNEKDNFENLLQTQAKSCYQSESKITDLLKNKLDEFINVINSNKKLKASLFIDKDKIKTKTYQYKYKSFHTDKDWNEIANLASLEAEQGYGEVKEIFFNGFIKYILKQTNKKQNKIIEFANHHYYNTFKYGMMLSTNLWGKELNKLKNTKYKEYFKNELFKENLATEIIEYLEGYKY